LNTHDVDIEVQVVIDVVHQAQSCRPRRRTQPRDWRRVKCKVRPGRRGRTRVERKLHLIATVSGPHVHALASIRYFCMFL